MADVGINFGGLAAAKNPHTQRFEDVKIDNAVSSKGAKKIGSFKEVLRVAKAKQSAEKVPISKINQSTPSLEFGTDLALKKLAKKFEDDLIGICYNMMFDTVGGKPPGGIGEELFQRDYIPSLVSSSSSQGSDDIKLGQIGEGIYKELKNNSR